VHGDDPIRTAGELDRAPEADVAELMHRHVGYAEALFGQRHLLVADAEGRRLPLMGAHRHVDAPRQLLAADADEAQFAALVDHGEWPGTQGDALRQQFGVTAAEYDS